MPVNSSVRVSPRNKLGIELVEIDLSFIGST